MIRKRIPWILIILFLLLFIFVYSYFINKPTKYYSAKNYNKYLSIMRSSDNYDDLIISKYESNNISKRYYGIYEVRDKSSNTINTYKFNSDYDLDVMVINFEFGGFIDLDLSKYKIEEVEYSSSILYYKNSSSIFYSCPKWIKEYDTTLSKSLYNESKKSLLGCSFYKVIIDGNSNILSRTIYIEFGYFDKDKTSSEKEIEEINKYMLGFIE